jgi:hypothetical protein
MHLQVLVDELGERDRRSSPSRSEPVEHFAKRRLCFRTRREPADLRPLRVAAFEPVPVRPQGLTVQALRLQLEHLTVLDHLEPP